MKTSRVATRAGTALLLAFLTSASAAAADVTWTGAGGDTNWATAGNWGGTAPSSGDRLIFSGGTRLTNINNLAADTSFSGITFASDAGAFVITGTGSGLNGIALTGSIVNSSSNLQKITLPITLNTTQTFDTGAAGLMLGATGGGASGVISGAGGIIKTGSGTLTLNATNTYTGDTVINEGTLLLANAGVGALSSSTAVSIASGALFNMGDRSATVGSIAGAGNINGTGNIILTVGGNNASTTFSGNLTFTGGAGSGTLVKNGTGTLTLSGTNTYGITTINAGTVVFGTTASKGTGTATAGAAGSIGLGVGGTGYYNATQVASLFNTNSLTGFSLATASGVGIDTTAGNFTQTVALTAARTLTKLGTNTLTLNTTNTYTGATVVTGGTLEALTLADGGSASAIGQSSNAAANLNLSGGATLAYTGAGAASTDRLFTVGEGGATIANNGAGTLTFTNTGNVAYGATDAARTISLAGSNTGANTLDAVVGDNGAGAVSFIKAGSGAWVLDAVNTYTGSTTVSAGTLLVNGSIANSAATVQSGATFGGSGTAGAIFLQNGSFLSPGSLGGGNAGTLKAASLDWSGGGVLRFNLGATSDALNLTGAFTKSGSGAYMFDFLDSAPAIGSYSLLTAGSISGFSVSDFSYANLSGLSGYFSLTSTNLTFTVVPEGDWAFATIPLAGLALLRRRRRAK